MARQILKRAGVALAACSSMASNASEPDPAAGVRARVGARVMSAVSLHGGQISTATPRSVATVPVTPRPTIRRDPASGRELRIYDMP